MWTNRNTVLEPSSTCLRSAMNSSTWCIGNQNATQETWLNEGASMVASTLCGYSLGNIASWYSENADVQLTSWSDDSKAALPHYAAAYLFMEYFAQHYGGYENFKTLISLPVRGQDSINTYLAREGYAVNFDDVFADWTAANLIDDEFAADGALLLRRPPAPHASPSGCTQRHLQ